MKNILVFIALGGLLMIMISSYSEMPPMGNMGNPSNNDVAQHYLTQGLEDTGAPNVIAVIITDYRAVDTLGEAAVLFTSIAAVLTVLAGKDKQGHEEEEGHHG